MSRSRDFNEETDPNGLAGSALLGGGGPKRVTFLYEIKKRVSSATSVDAIYVSSSGINDMVAKKHTLKLTASNHENESDVICVRNPTLRAGTS